MAANTTEMTRISADREKRHSPHGLLRDYAHGRLRFLFIRLIMLAVILGVILVLCSVQEALLIAAYCFLSEGVDSGTLYVLRRRILRNEPLGWLANMTTITAGIQASGGAACVLGVLHSTPGQPALALTFLMAAVTYAGMFWSYHRKATIAHIAVYAATTVAVVVDSITQDQVPSGIVVANLAATLIVAYVAFLFIRFFNDTFDAQRNSRQTLMRHGQELAQANARLLEQQRENRWLAQVAEHASDSVIISDAKERIAWVNDAFSQLTGYQLDEVRGKTPAEVLNAPGTCAKTSAAITNALLKGKPYRTQILNRTKAGRDIWIGVNRVPILDENGEVESVIAIERDISDIKQREENLARAKDAAEDVAQAKARFLAAMSHEIRTPMNGIIGMAEVLSDRSLPREEQQMIDTIRRSGEALLKIINDILDFSKLDAGKVELYHVAFEPRAVIEDVVALLGPEARRKGLTMDVTLDPDVPEQVMGDDGRLRQILLNIIGNAVKFTAKGGIIVRLSGPGCSGKTQGRLQGKTPDEPGCLCIRVEDTGVGIPPDRLDHVFDEFAQADSATTRQFGGTGLGLPISQHLARVMGGDVTLSSTLGEGSVFTVSIHVEPVDGPATQKTDTIVDPQSLAGLKILVAEDNKTNRLLLRKYLDDVPVHLRMATNGREAVEAALGDCPDIVLMDMAMPEMDGLTAARKIRASDISQPHIIALTANAFASDKAACLAAGMDAFLSKPLRKSELLALLGSLATTDNTASPRRQA